jgi:hypothetical protein
LLKPDLPQPIQLAGLKHFLFMFGELLDSILPMLGELFITFRTLGVLQGLEEWPRFHDLRHQILHQLLLLLVGDLELVQDFVAEKDEWSAQGFLNLLALLLRNLLGSGSLERLGLERDQGQSHHSGTETGGTLHCAVPFVLARLQRLLLSDGFDPPLN